MGYIIDGVLIAIIIICAIIGIAKGLFDSLLGLISTGIALAIAVFTAKYLVNFVNRIFGLEEFILGKLNTANEGSVEFFGGEFTNGDVAKFCVWLITVITIFLLIKLVVFILAKIFESATSKSPTLSGINRLFGLIFGAIKGMTISAIIIAMGSLLSEVPGVGPTITDYIAQTKLTNIAYKYVDEFVDQNLTKEKVQDLINKVISEAKDETPKDTIVEGTEGETAGSITPPVEE